MRVSSVDQHPETQLHDLRQMAAQRGFEIVEEFTDRISGTKAKRPGLDQLMMGARRGRFDVILAWASDRIARSVKHFLEVLDELNRLNVEFISFREQIDTSGPLGRAIVVIIGAIAELERNLIVERVRAACGAPASKAGISAAIRWRSIMLRSGANAARATACVRSPRRIAFQQPPFNACFESTPKPLRSELRDRTLDRSAYLPGRYRGAGRPYLSHQPVSGNRACQGLRVAPDTQADRRRDPGHQRLPQPTAPRTL
jgi:hypothetical protein